MPAKLQVIAEAVPFCFGPAATLLAVTQQLMEHDVHVTYLAEGTSAQLIRLTHPQSEIIPCDTTRKADVEAHLNRLRQADLVITNTNPDFARWSIDWNCRTAVIDTLFWMWDHIDDRLASATPYLAQNFEGIEEQKQRLPVFKGARVVGPLVPKQSPPIPHDQREDLLLISFGGVGCPLVHSEAPQYPDIMIGPILNALTQRRSFQRVLICGGANMASGLAHHSLPKSVQLTCLSRTEHIAALRRCRAALISPGLTSFFEALDAQTPMFFLPPQNYSQVLQLRAYRKLGIGESSLSWDDLGLGQQIGPYWPEELAVKSVRECLEQFAQRTDFQEELTNRIGRFLESVRSKWDCAHAGQVRTRFGHNGPEQAAEAILAELA